MNEQSVTFVNLLDAEPGRQQALLDLLTRGVVTEIR